MAAPAPRPSEALVTLDDGAVAAGPDDEARAAALHTAVCYAEPTLAAGASFFGIGLLVLPLVDQLGAADPRAAEADAFSYRGVGARAPGLFSPEELKGRLGPLDPSQLCRELSQSSAEVAEHARRRGEEATRREVARLRRWRARANQRLALLQRRCALTFLGLPLEARESDISGAYKRKALELHPDKGGDPQEFQQLQQARDWLEEPRVAQRGPEEDDEAEEPPERPPDGAGKLRADLHDSALRLWERHSAAAGEIESRGGGAAPPSGQALDALHAFLGAFTAREVHALRRCDARSLDTVVRKLVRRGAEVLAASAAADAPAAVAAVRAGFVQPLAARCAVPEAAGRCGDLLAALLAVPAGARRLLRSLDAGAAQGSSATAKQKAHEPGSRRRRPAPEVEPPPDQPPAEPPPAAEQPPAEAAEPPPRKSLQRLPPADEVVGCDSDDEPGPPLSQPAPFKCGGYRLHVRADGLRGSLEEVRAELWDADMQVAWLRGLYIFRYAGFKIGDACRIAAARIDPRAATLLDAEGRPKPPLAGLLSPQAHDGGFFYLEDVYLARHLRGRGLGLELVAAALRSLTGPLKRVTLVLCKLAARPGEAPGRGGGGLGALERHWARLGFRRALEGQDLWFVEPAALRPPAAVARAPPGGRAAAAPPAKRPRAAPVAAAAGARPVGAACAGPDIPTI
ncbi:unnamed protein product [Prorocentrum cordatum]|uniref:J domain-containing protein n=1 Tax=Prorocentrum cordatum TaxID=2364126 RepID=A0ABN9PZB5_9DINO|nr:unnamed protein product [Polarella glacialis]